MVRSSHPGDSSRLVIGWTLCPVCEACLGLGAWLNERRHKVCRTRKPRLGWASLSRREKPFDFTYLLLIGKIVLATVRMPQKRGQRTFAKLVLSRRWLKLHEASTATTISRKAIHSLLSPQKKIGQIVSRPRHTSDMIRSMYVTETYYTLYGLGRHANFSVAFAKLCQ